MMGMGDMQVEAERPCRNVGGFLPKRGGTVHVEAGTDLPTVMPPGILPFTEDNGSPGRGFQASPKVAVLPGVPLSSTSGALSAKCLLGGRNGAGVQR